VKKETTLQGMPGRWTAEGDEWVRIGPFEVRMTDRGLEVYQIQGQVVVVEAAASNHLFIREAHK